MHKSWAKLSEWLEHESALMQPRVRQSKKLRGALFVTVKQQIQIDRAWAKRYLARAAQSILNSQQTSHCLLGRRQSAAPQLGHHVQKSWLLKCFDGLGFVDG